MAKNAFWNEASRCGALGYGFYGLFISIGAKRDPDMFDSSDEE